MATSALARTDLEALLRARRLDRTVARPEGLADAAEPARERCPEPGRSEPCRNGAADQALSTGIAQLDVRLGGGLPRGQLSEIVGARSSGRTAVLCAALAATTSRGALAALVDPLDMFDAESAASCGVTLERLLWLRGEATSRQSQVPAGISARPAIGVVPVGRAVPVFERALDRAVKALNLVLQAGGFDLVVLDLAEMPLDAIRRLPFTTWFRLQRVLEGSRTVCLFLGPAPIARSGGGVSIRLSRASGRRPAAKRDAVISRLPDRPITRMEHTPDRGLARWPGGEWSARLFLGLESEARIVRARDPEEGGCQLAIAAW